MLRSSWQSVNIGDIGHTPGALSLLKKHFSECEITLWPGELGHGIPAMFLLDQSGKIVTTTARGEKLGAEVKRLLKL